MIKNNNVKIMGVFASFLLLVIVITASFAYFGSFNISLNNNVAVNVNSVSPGDGTFTSNATQLNLQVPAVNMSQTQSNNTVAALENTATLSVSLTSGSAEVETTCTFDIYYEYTGNNFYGVSPNTKTSGVTKEITMTVNAPSGTSNFSTETNFDYNTSTGWVTENSKRKVKLVENASITNSGTTATVQEYTFTGKYYNLDINQEQLANKSFTGIIYVNKNACTSKEALSTFTINNIPYNYQKGMTFNDWFKSKYNTFGYNVAYFGTSRFHARDYSSELIESKNYNLISELTSYGYNIYYLSENLAIGKNLHDKNADMVKKLYSNDIINSLSSIDSFTFQNEITESDLLYRYYPLIIEDDGSEEKDADGKWIIQVARAYGVPLATNKVLTVFYDTELENFQIYQVPGEDVDIDNHQFTFKAESLNGVFIFLFFK